MLYLKALLWLLTGSEARGVDDEVAEERQESLQRASRAPKSTSTVYTRRGLEKRRAWSGVDPGVQHQDYPQDAAAVPYPQTNSIAVSLTQ